MKGNPFFITKSSFQKKIETGFINSSPIDVILEQHPDLLTNFEEKPEDKKPKSDKTDKKQKDKKSKQSDSKEANKPINEIENNYKVLELKRPSMPSEIKLEKEEFDKESFKILNQQFVKFEENSSPLNELIDDLSSISDVYI